MRPSNWGRANLICLASVSAVARGQTPTTAPSDADLRDQVRQMRVEMDQMRAHEAAMEKQLAATTQPTAAMRAEEDRAVDAVYQDALQRTRLLTQLPIGTGYDTNLGFYIASDDGSFRMHPFALLQVRDVTTYLHGSGGGSDDTQNGCEIRRLQLGVDGTVFNPDLAYRAFIQNDRSTGDMELKDAWVRYHFPDSPWAIEAGQFKVPLDHEAQVYDRTLLAVERTLTDDTLDLSYLPNGSPVDDNGSGVLVDNGHTELIFRAQVQLAL